MSVKEIVLEAIRQLPPDATYDDVLEEIAILAAIERGQQAIADGKTISQEEFEIETSRWTIGKEICQRRD